jgi:phosphoenolpyruvate-protein phosphotransferase
MKKGIPVSPGIAVARAFRLTNGQARLESRPVEVSELSAEVERFTAACVAAARELDATIARVSREVGENEAAIFRAHRGIVQDPALVNKVKSTIQQRHIDARGALQETLDEYAKLFEQIDDEYLRERWADIRDVVGRIMAHLSQPEGGSAAEPQEQEPVILIAPEILPSQAMALDRVRIAGLLTETGGSTGHAAILARSLGIPAVSGLRGIAREVETGDLIALDGREGHVYVNPGPEVESAYRKLQREYVDLRDRLIENRDEEPVTADGIRVELLANVNGPADAVAACNVGAGGIGLYRTEYLFLTHPTVPDEEEQYAAYREVVECAPNRLVTIRTLDLGGDKHVPYLGNPKEANPFMGWRSIRLSASHPEFFQTQLRAIFRAARHGKVSVMFPMVSTLEEVKQLKRMVERSRLSLARQNVAFADDVRIGIMLEVPAAALCVDDMLAEVDFVSIGSNDMIQYLMAADRDNPKVAHLCDPFAPAVYRLLAQVLSACHLQGKPVTLCGEMASLPRCFLPLFGMGLRSLSMSPAFVPALKALVRCTTFQAAKAVTERVVHLRTVREIRAFLARQVRQVCPNVALLDVKK